MAKSLEEYLNIKLADAEKKYLKASNACVCYIRSMSTIEGNDIKTSLIKEDCLSLIRYADDAFAEIIYCKSEIEKHL